MSKLFIIAIPDHKLRFAVIRLLSQNEYHFICAKNLPKLCHEITNLEEEALLIIDIFAYSSPLYRALNSLGTDEKLKCVFLMDEEGMARSRRFLDDGSWRGVEKKYLNEQLLSVIDQIHGKRTVQEEKSPNDEREVYLMPEQEENLFSKEIGRRSFLKGAAAAAAVTGMATADPGRVVMALTKNEEAAATTVKEETFHSVCKGACNCACRLKIKVRDGKIVQTAMAQLPDPAYNGICLKGLSHAQRVYNSSRLKYPMKRAGERGAGQWERITWDEAIETIGSSWEQLRSQYGNTSIAFNSYGGNMERTGRYMLYRVANLMGASIIDAAVDVAHVQYSLRVLGFAENCSANELADIVNSKCIIAWGANPTDALVPHWHFFAEARKNGAKLITIDPNFSGIASKSDMHVPLRPGTDAALALGMMNIVVRENWIDEPFLKKSSVAPFLVKETDGKYLRQSDMGIAVSAGATDEPLVWNSTTKAPGPASAVADPVLHGTYTINGIKVTTAYDLLLSVIAEYPPEKVAKICDVPVEKMEELTKLYVTNSPSWIFTGFGIDHWVNGSYNYFAILSLAIITGNLGKSGTSAGCWGFSGDAGLFNYAQAFPAAEAVKPGPTVVVFQLPEVMETGKYAGNPLTLKSAYIARWGSLSNSPDRQALLKAFDKMDLIVVADVEMSDSAMYADIVLPVCYWFETDALYANYTPFVTLEEKVIEPLYESKTDFEIAKLLGKRMGFAAQVDTTLEDVLRKALNTDFAKTRGITYDELKNKKTMRAMSKGSNGLYIKDIYPTATGRAQFYLENPAPTSNYGQQIDYTKEKLPSFVPPHEAWHENPLFEKYPLVMFQEHVKFRVHTNFGRVPWLRELDPEPIVKINGADAEARGIKTGDTVKVYNDRGYVVIKAVISNGLRPGMVNIPHGWQKDQFIEGHYQDMTSRVHNPVCVNSAFFDTLVEIKKM